MRQQCTKLDTEICFHNSVLGSPLTAASISLPFATSVFATSPVVATSLLFATLATRAQADSPLHQDISDTSPAGSLVESDVNLMLTEQKRDYTCFDGQFCPVAIAAFQDLLFLLCTHRWKTSSAQGQKFVRDEQLPYFGCMPEEEVHNSLFDLIDDAVPSSEETANKIRVLAEVVISSNSNLAAIINALQKAFRAVSQIMSLSATGGVSSVTRSSYSSKFFNWKMLRDPDCLSISWSESLELREDEKDPSFVEFIVFHCGYDLLRQGVMLDSSDARWIGTPGFRSYTQTYMSLTDPGDGHIFGMTCRARWLKGALCHVEHLERLNNLARSEIESYRVPSMFEFARVHLHTGNTAPNTYFVGRKGADSESAEFGYDFIKIVNLTAAACTAAFQLGAAEAKIAMDGLTSSQMVAYMRSLSRHVLRNHKQVLSCAFNINMPFTDDLTPPNEDGSFKVISNQMQIGRRGIDIAALAGAQKVTFDGAGDSAKSLLMPHSRKVPSQCIIVQLKFQNVLELVHLAHQSGLTTYMSAGFKFAHIADTVLSGVDGIGIGGAQVLRYMDNVSGQHGPYTEENIDRINEQRDNAANSVCGRGVHLLTRLDRMFFEGSITAKEEAVRPLLYTALYEEEEEKIANFLKMPMSEVIMSLPDDGKSPTLGVAGRLLRLSQPLIRGQIDREALGDEKEAYAYYSSQSWVNLRKLYRQDRAFVRDDLQYTVNAAPYCKMVPYTRDD
ncbi:hypothetical protein CALVIDRAFT_553576 [Calocera viscosa TUFC12733]|uniref:Uncharacterized protein n=1 Tax=Calocera viscosa (strain TUFC12733) TaxID=1330018 RepID=A0A167PEL0_CALVF|nr:hypothetical protein CALVIDRAFT_553576 [Calocera viscosa TUFC12733]